MKSFSMNVRKTILTILAVVFLSNLSAKAQDVQNVLRKLPGFSAPQMGEVNRTLYEFALADLLNELNYVPKRGSFPPNFMFGAGSSALQVEGADQEGGRGAGVWDEKVNHQKGRFADTDKFSTKIEHYYRYQEDVIHLKNLGINTYRMSISWSRILPDGTIKGGINQVGVDFYNHLFDELLANGITPFVTLVHFDYPLTLHKQFGGFLSSSMVEYYKDFCELVFKLYGDRVKHWITMNEPQIVGLFTYMHGFDNEDPDIPCQKTKFCTQAYNVVHNYILCHATAVKLYREKFKATQKGEIGLVLGSQSFEPFSSKPEDVAATERLMDFFMGWILDPVVFGDYPKVMRELVGNRLPNFTQEQKKLITGSTDFIGINYYTSRYGRNEPNRNNVTLSDNYDSSARSEFLNSEGKPLGYMDLHGGNFVYPKGLYDILLRLKNKYKNPNIYITENGIGSVNLTDPLRDMHRIKYLATHLNYTKAAIDNGVNVRGYFVWAAFDTFEFGAGYTQPWGLIHVNFKDHLKRERTDSAKWYRRFLTHPF